MVRVGAAVVVAASAGGVGAAVAAETDKPENRSTAYQTRQARAVLVLVFE